MSDWRTVSIKLKDDQVAVLNLRLKQLGFETMGDFARAMTDGVVGNRQLFEDLAEAIADKLVVKMTTNPELQQFPPADLSVKVVGSPGFEPGISSARG